MATASRNTSTAAKATCAMPSRTPPIPPEPGSSTPFPNPVRGAQRSRPGRRRHQRRRAHGHRRLPTDGGSSRPPAASRSCGRITPRRSAAGRVAGVAGRRGDGVYDVNGDGLNDVVTVARRRTAGASPGLSRSATRAGKISFVEHIITDDFMTKNAGGVTFSELHGTGSPTWTATASPTLSRASATGRISTITPIPIPTAPPVLYWYKTVRNPEGAGRSGVRAGVDPQPFGSRQCGPGGRPERRRRNGYHYYYGQGDVHLLGQSQTAGAGLAKVQIGWGGPPGASGCDSVRRRDSARRVSAVSGAAAHRQTDPAMVRRSAAVWADLPALLPGGAARRIRLGALAEPPAGHPPEDRLPGRCSPLSLLVAAHSAVRPLEARPRRRPAARASWDCWRRPSGCPISCSPPPARCCSPGTRAPTAARCRIGCSRCPTPAPCSDS